MKEQRINNEKNEMGSVKRTQKKKKNEKIYSNAE